MIRNGSGKPIQLAISFWLRYLSCIRASGVLNFLLDHTALWVGGLRKVGIDLQLRHIGLYRVAGLQV